MIVVPVNRLAFVIMLYLTGVFSLVGGLGELYEKSRYWLHGEHGYMESADPDLASMLKNGLYRPLVDVSYVTPTRRFELIKQPLPQELAQRLNAGQQIRVYFLRNHPQEAYYDYQEPNTPWGWLILGVAALCGGRYALLLYRREQGRYG